MAVSIIVPVYQEPNLNAFLAQFKSLKGEFELILVTCEELNLSGNFKLLKSQKGRAVQQNCGANAARYENLWFLHADSAFQEDSVLHIENSLLTSDVGCFELEFDDKSWLMKVCASLSNLRVKVRNIAFGDQGIFIKKELFEKIGGFSQLPIMEDYELSLRLRKYTFKLLPAKITTSARRFHKFGVLKTIAKMQLAQLKFRLNYDIEKIAKSYNEA
ncbi:TIGR04283 family arsenosugar biosynthesis glycosyltransferase [Campylobacter geochelonis]|uniref:Transferase 2, rSAM/selenodomain-associated n=1 Tax=Campylobacter geochelonis TaxID=1780362 RepID=A0A128EAG1_9BACT|nr:TIGR04283 family arsenosugar biosynthesis glycosyltransferase [Campylobacter geochelonis]QKF70597.1 glycosyltransferase, family 2 [Campylobacter geochelonis]CZE45960.1 transferase 2%2C rSAM/selenodomain-associated [Campylobacter geochelonis]CZE46674.1 transferase 2%2C rSAM/selenodomain-associated [Campylobacter geochelonis]CZE50360.1 transferase 2%2C rSAM/selenodomain-associated [Campylobacter geochelonis]